MLVKQCLFVYNSFKWFSAIMPPTGPIVRRRLLAAAFIVLPVRVIIIYITAARLGRRINRRIGRIRDRTRMYTIWIPRTAGNNRFDIVEFHFFCFGCFVFFLHALSPFELRYNRSSKPAGLSGHTTRIRLPFRLPVQNCCPPPT